MDSSFLVPKISAKFDCGHLLRGRQMQVGWVKIDDFPQITGYISKTVQDRRMVSCSLWLSGKLNKVIICHCLAAAEKSGKFTTRHQKMLKSIRG